MRTGGVWYGVGLDTLPYIYVLDVCSGLSNVCIYYEISVRVGRIVTLMERLPELAFGKVSLTQVIDRIGIAESVD